MAVLVLLCVFLTHLLASDALFLVLDRWLKAANRPRPFSLFILTRGIGPVLISWCLYNLLLFAPGRSRGFYVGIVLALLIAVLVAARRGFPRLIEAYRELGTRLGRLSRLRGTNAVLLASVVILCLFMFMVGIGLPIVAHDSLNLAIDGRIMHRDLSLERYLAGTVADPQTGYVPNNFQTPFLSVLYAWYGLVAGADQMDVLARTTAPLYALYCLVILAWAVGRGTNDEGEAQSNILSASLLLASTPLLLQVSYDNMQSPPYYYLSFLTLIWFSRLLSHDGSGWGRLAPVVGLFAGLAIFSHLLASPALAAGGIALLAFNRRSWRKRLTAAMSIALVALLASGSYHYTQSEQVTTRLARNFNLAFVEEFEQIAEAAGNRVNQLLRSDPAARERARERARARAARVAAALTADEVPAAPEVAAEMTPAAPKVTAEKTPPPAPKVTAEKTPAAPKVAAEKTPAASKVTAEKTPPRPKVTAEKTPPPAPKVAAKKTPPLAPKAAAKKTPPLAPKVAAKKTPPAAPKVAAEKTPAAPKVAAKKTPVVPDVTLEEVLRARGQTKPLLESPGASSAHGPTEVGLVVARGQGRSPLKQLLFGRLQMFTGLESFGFLFWLFLAAVLAWWRTRTKTSSLDRILLTGAAVYCVVVLSGVRRVSWSNPIYIGTLMLVAAYFAGPLIARMMRWAGRRWPRRRAASVAALLVFLLTPAAVVNAVRGAKVGITNTGGFYEDARSFRWLEALSQGPRTALARFWDDYLGIRRTFRYFFASRDEQLRHAHDHFGAILYFNEHTPPDSVALVFRPGRYFYYAQRRGIPYNWGALANANGKKSFAGVSQYLDSIGVTHVLTDSFVEQSPRYHSDLLFPMLRDPNWSELIYSYESANVYRLLHPQNQLQTSVRRDGSSRGSNESSSS